MPPFVSGVERLSDDRYHRMYMMYTFVFMQSLFETNPDARLYFFVDKISDGDIERIKRLAFGRNLAIVRLSDRTRKLISKANHPINGRMCCIRCFLPKILDERECVWIDSDTIVTGPLSGIFDDARKACSESGMFVAAVLDSIPLSTCPTDPYLNAGVSYFDLDGLRRSGESERMEDLVLSICGKRSARSKFADQDALNMVGMARISAKWNEQRHPSLRRSCSREYLADSDSVRGDVRVYHAVGMQKSSMPNLHGDMPDAFFRSLSRVVCVLGPSVLSFNGGEEFMKRLKSVDKEEVF